MTLHAAKGLEFPAVFMIGCEAGLLPFERGETDHEAKSRLEEERRLAFVGMTRAMDSLTMSAVRSRMIRGHTTPQAPSQFLSEIGSEDIVVEDRTTAPTGGRFPARHSASGGGFYADSQERQIIEQMAAASADFPPEYEYLQVGSRVRHPQFGLGTVKSLNQPWPRTRAKIEFQTVGTKTIVLQAAHLEIL